MIISKKTEKNITLAKFNSSTIIQSVYYQDNNFLYIFFKGGNVYSYQPISKELYDGFEKAESQGKYLNKNIKSNKFISYRKETKLKEHELESLINNLFK